ncbi:hypothetical protein [Staphylococcus phage vB_StaM_PB50]|nr:hypothetical protein [Staphylococcus phage vB_StaM_PB50]
MSILIEESKIVNKLVMTFEEISKLFNNIENGNKLIDFKNNVFTNGSNLETIPNNVNVQIKEDNPIYDYLLPIEYCSFNVEDFIQVRTNKADKIIKVEFFNDEDNKGIKFTRESDLETIIDDKDYHIEENINEEYNYTEDAIKFLKESDPFYSFNLDEKSLLYIKECKPSEFFKCIFTENEMFVREPYYIYDEDDYLIDFRTSKKYLLGLKYKTTKGNIVCPEVHVDIFAPETDVYSEFILLKFSISQDKFIANLDFLIYNI